ncbi:thiamine biosynthesis protein ApbE [Thermotoga sp. Ku-13t]|uniref:UPF0280 family protein n=1 Tax=Thermotoga sp. Ku-13t TaxID=1755813 RepID=UPI0013EA52E5|nr:UPF0280 family protein [Thermotoga sp. Ku-13t]KAF2958694.1 thiamine biosynthesis protein ApbE [Thermotoga sp. Ku-13t]
MRRFYRNFHSQRLHAFTVRYKETDLWIGVDRYDPQMPEAVLGFVEDLYRQLLEVAKVWPEFFSSLEPVELSDGPKVAMKMVEAAKLAGVGPTAAVAGAFADEVGEFLLKNFDCEEVIVENGGDIFIKCSSDIVSAVYAGSSPLSGRVGLKIPEGSWGVCTSSGRFGHSLSFGNADAVTVISSSATIADAFATAYCNMVKKKEDVEDLLKCAINENVLGVLVIFEDKLGVKGQFEIVLLKGDANEAGR